MSLELKAVFTVRELARAAEQPANRVKKIFESHGVPLLTVGPRTHYVLLADLKEHFPYFWDSLMDHAAAKAL